MRELSEVLRVRRSRLFGHMERREGSEALERVVKLEVPGQGPLGRPRKTLRQCIEENLAA